MAKQYPLYEYVNFNGKSIKFAYKYTEEEMYNDEFNNGLYHYNYFEDMCKKYIKKHYRKYLFYRERSGPATISSTKLFLHNLFTINKNKKIHIIQPMKWAYANKNNLTANQLISDRYKTIIVQKCDTLDMISKDYTGTRAYADLIARANGLTDYTVKPGQVLKLPIDLIGDGVSSDNIYEIKANKTQVYRISNLAEFDKKIKDDNFKPIEGSLFVIDGPTPHRIYVYTNGKYIQISI